MANYFRNNNNNSRDYNSRQDFGSYGFQIYVFKVEIDCCRECPETLRSKLKDLDGIESVDVDVRRNLATVKATIDSRKIIKKLKEWGKFAELVDEKKETNANGYRVELIDDDEEEKDRFNDSFRHKDSSDRHKDSSYRHNHSSDHHNHSSSRARDRNNRSTHAPEKYDYSERNAYAAKEVPEHICRDKYCRLHRRDNYMPNMNYGAGYPPLFRGGLNYNFPPMNSYAPGPYGPPPPPPYQYGQYYDPGMVPPGYGSYSKYNNGCSIM